MSQHGPGAGRRADLVTALALVRAAVVEDDEALDRVVAQLTDDDARRMAGQLARIAGQFLVEGVGHHDSPAVGDFLGRLLFDLARRDGGRG